MNKHLRTATSKNVAAQMSDDGYPDIFFCESWDSPITSSKDGCLSSNDSGKGSFSVVNLIQKCSINIRIRDVNA